MKICITGASRGVGQAIALGFAAQGAELTLVGRNSEKQQAVIKQLSNINPASRVELMECDFAQLDQVEALSSQLATMPAFDVMIHNAGIIERASAEECTLASWQRQMNVNLTAPTRLTQGVLPAMKRVGRGRILFVSSISAVLGCARQGAYHASKSGIVGFMRCLAEEISDTGLMTMALLPGAIDTDMLKGSGFPPRMTSEDLFATIEFYATKAPLAHNGASVEMFGI